MELIMNFGLSPSAKKPQNPCSRPPPVFQDLSTHHDWRVNKAIVNLPVRLKGNLKFILDKSLSLLGAKNLIANKDTLYILRCFTDITDWVYMLFAHMRFCDLRKAI